MRKLLSLLALTFFAVNANAETQTEKILWFNSSIIVNKDASIDITETISAYANREQILHGIVRRLPIDYRDSYGVSHHTNYILKNVAVNAAPTAYHTSNDRNQFSIYIGEKNITLAPGLYVYSIQYHVDDAVNFLKETDELYWNITGNAWTFPIFKTDVDITLPDEAQISQFAGYTGKAGEKQRGFHAQQIAPNKITFTTNQPLSPGEGLTIAVAWQKGVIQQPTKMGKLSREFQFNRESFLQFLIFLLPFSYFFIAWQQLGRGPKKGVIVPLFEPPANLSPAATRYIMRMGFDVKTFTAAIVSMATKHFVTMKNENDVYTLTKTGTNQNQLSAEENAIANALFKNKNEIVLTQDNYETISAAKKGLSNELKAAFNNVEFITNSSNFFTGLAWSVIAFVIIISFANDTPTAIFAAIWLTAWTFACYALGYSSWINITAFLNNKSITRFFAALFSFLFLLPFLAGEIAGFFIFGTSMSYITMTLLLLIAIINIVFYHILKAPTVTGRKIMDQIEGFKMYLGTTEGYRFDKLNPPEKTPELFEKYLPYAIALNVENAWGQKFNEVLAHAGTEAQPYQPTWYAGAPLTANQLAAFPSSLNSSLTSAISTSSIDPSSSASGGSSGSSGGGGGGGGGGGW